MSDDERAARDREDRVSVELAERYGHRLGYHVAELAPGCGDDWHVTVYPGGHKGLSGALQRAAALDALWGSAPFTPGCAHIVGVYVIDRASGEAWLIRLVDAF
jgi:hypothetical protein